MISEKLTNLMNAVRSKYALTDKLSVDDATGHINSEYFNNVVVDSPHMLGNDGHANISDGVLHFEADVDNTHGTCGVYHPYSAIKPGGRYSFFGLVRGNILITLIGDEATRMMVNKQLAPDRWIKLSFAFVAKNDFIIYGKAKKGDWMELKNWSLSELGGVIRRLLADVFPSRLEVAA